MLFNLSVKAPFDPAYSLYVVEAASIEEAAQDLGVEIGSPGADGEVEVLCDEAVFRLGAEWIRLVPIHPIIPDHPGPLVNALDRLEKDEAHCMRHSYPFSRRDWLDELELRASESAKTVPTPESEVERLWRLEVKANGTEMQKLADA